MTQPISTIDGTQLVVNGRPFTVLGAEIHNSSSSTVAAIAESFRKVAALGANTVLAPVAWSLLEPEEGAFDFTLVDTMIDVAQESGLKLIPLWFGSWKNGTSSYVPAWVKRDVGRFPRALIQDGRPVEHLTPFSDEARDADAAAFRALMRHLGQVDVQHTVIMVQVENEVGLLGDARDRSELADVAWSQQVPPAFIDALGLDVDSPVSARWQRNGRLTNGSWATVLGETAEADEAFMAWAYARYIDAVAAAGRAEHDVPLFANVWLDSPMELDMPDAPDLSLAGGLQPGDYPSGGPVPRVVALWRAAAPSLDMVAPDFYFGDFSATMDRYSNASEGRLFIPEMRRSATGVSHMFLALGTYRALGVSPFGVDSFDEDEPAARTMSDAYALLRVVAQEQEARPDAACRGFALTEAHPEQTITVGRSVVTVAAVDSFRQLPPFPAYGILLEEESGVVLAVGRGFTVSFPEVAGIRRGIERASEIAADGTGRIVRELNGDETMGGSGVRLHALGATAPAVFPIPLSTVSTGVLRLVTYTY